MVVNSILAAMAKHSYKPGHELTIYHVGSSLRNPIKYKELKWLMYDYLKKNPLFDNRGKPIKVGEIITLTSMTSLLKYIGIHYLPFLKAKVFFNYSIIFPKK